VFQNNSNSGEYARYFEVIATPNNFELFDAGYGTNVYGDQEYAFNFNVDFNVAPYVDDFGFPATELFLYAKYRPSSGKYGPETFSGTSWGINGIATKTALNLNTLSIGDRVYGDLIEYGKPDFYQVQVQQQTYYITTPYRETSSSPTQRLQWKYNPFISFQLRYFNDNLNHANTGTTSYGQEVSIPYYATSLGDGNYVWKDILPQGLIDPTTDLGVDYPFINKRRYLFKSIILDVSPDLNDSNTMNVFAEIQFGQPKILNTAPINDLNNIGKPCQ